jgi:hypothetical protein
LDFIHARKSSLRLIQVGIVAGKREFDLNAIRKPLEKNLEARSGGLQLETEPASVKHRGLKFDGSFGFETHSIAKVAYSSACGRSQAFVGIHLQNDWMVLRRQIHVLLAQETSQASRQSGQ